MHVPNIIARWAHVNVPVRRQQTTAKTTAAATTGNLVSSILNPITTNLPATTTNAPATTNTPKDDNTTQDNQTTNTPQPTTTSSPSTSAKNSAPTTTSKPATTLQTSQKGQSSSSVVTETVDSSTDLSMPTDSQTLSAPAVTSTGKHDTNSGGFSGIKGSQVGMAVGIVVGIAGGFAIIIGGIYLWRRHQRRKQMERLGSMEELTRAPSPPLLSRSLTQGRNGPRQPIDDDDDDFLTPMDTLPNTHRLDDYKGEDDHYNEHTREMSMYSTDGGYYHDPDTGAPQLDSSFPVPPPAAVVPANARFYSGDLNSGSSSPQSSGSIPTYSSMNKYAAYTPGANTAAVAASTQAYGTPGAAVTSNKRNSSYTRVSSFSRPGIGYRGVDNASPSPSTAPPTQPASGGGLGDFKF